jgi:hypothetical protein
MQELSDGFNFQQDVWQRPTRVDQVSEDEILSAEEIVHELRVCTELEYLQIRVW